MNLDFCLRYFKDNLNVFFIKNKKKIISLNILIITYSDPIRLGLTWLLGPGAWVMSDPDIKLKKNREKKRREDRISIEGIKNS